ncbi:universal stress protein [Nocardia sp. CA2R105]|uniref:universal stress protein n=1 Tax=Nocardia coffeae TaxID=2873381 RepID=UPI001CA64A58|nr:universal stress protein [Nocardia coffeae]MBY8857226.1 universal stress protein [Nocardia coffeae]
MTEEVRQTGTRAPIVTATDGSAVSYQAVAWAAAAAALHDCPLDAVASVGFQGAYGPVPYLTAEAIEQMRESGAQIMAEAVRIASEVTAADSVEIRSEVTFDPIIATLITHSRTARALVVGSRGRGTIQRALLGSVSWAMIHHAHCPVVVVSSSAGTDPVSARKPVLVGVDGSVNNVPAVALAFREAALRGVGLTALRCWSDSTDIEPPLAAWEPVREKEFALLLEDLAVHRERHPEVPVHGVVVRDQPARALLAESDSAQLVVVGSRGRGGFAGMLLGSTSRALVQSVECPIVVVREPGVATADE